MGDESRPTIDFTDQKNERVELFFTIVNREEAFLLSSGWYLGVYGHI